MIGGNPLRVADVTELSCRSNYSGNHLPVLDWYRHCVDRHTDTVSILDWYRADTHISPEETQDLYDIRLARRDIRVRRCHGYNLLVK